MHSYRHYSSAVIQYRQDADRWHDTLLNLTDGSVDTLFC